MLEQNQSGKIQELKRPRIMEKMVPKTVEDSGDEAQIVKIQNKTKLIKKVDLKSQRWTVKQNKTYVKFLEEYAHLFRYKSVRRVRQVFILLSDKMNQKRTPAQCKSHHQKMRKATQNGTIKQIIRHMKGKHLSKERMAMNYLEKLENKQNNSSKDEFEIITRVRYNKFQISVKVHEELISIW